MKISVIVPIYNASAYLENTIKSILNQSFSDFELILIDDGSTDKSFAISEKYAVADDKVVSIRKENTGVSDTRNRALMVAKGEYITFIDADDTISPNYLENLYNSCENCDICCCVVDSVNENSEFISSKGLPDGECSGKEAIEMLLNFNLLSTGPCAKLFKRDLIGFNDIKFPKYKCYEDVYFCYEVFKRAKRVAFTQKSTYYYYHRGDNSAMDKFEKNPTTDVIDVMDYLIEDLKINDKDSLLKCFYQIIMQPLLYINAVLHSKNKSASKKYLKALKKLLAKNRKLINICVQNNNERAYLKLLSYTTLFVK